MAGQSEHLQGQDDNLKNGKKAENQSEDNNLVEGKNKNPQ